MDHCKQLPTNRLASGVQWSQGKEESRIRWHLAHVRGTLLNNLASIGPSSLIHKDCATPSLVVVHANGHTTLIFPPSSPPSQHPPTSIHMYNHPKFNDIHMLVLILGGGTLNAWNRKEKLPCYLQLPPPPLQSPTLAHDGLLAGAVAHLVKGPRQWPTHVHQVCLSGTVHSHREKTSWV